MYTIIVRNSTEQRFEGIAPAHVPWLIGQLLEEYRYHTQVEICIEPAQAEPAAE